MIQGTCVEEVQAHSGCVVTVIVPVPPAAPIVFGPDRETVHLTGDGARAEVDVEPQPLTAIAIAATIVARQTACRGDPDFSLVPDRKLADKHWSNMNQVIRTVASVRRAGPVASSGNSDPRGQSLGTLRLGIEEAWRLPTLGRGDCATIVRLRDIQR